MNFIHFYLICKYKIKFRKMKVKLIVGLGNPGEEYENTRHNLGFRVVGYLNKEYGRSFTFDKKSDSEVSEIKVNGKKILLAKPQIFMNNSGQAIKKLIENLKFKIENLVIVHDDLDIPFGKVKMSFARGSAGHKGVESIIRALKTDKFYRIRIGTFNNQLAKIRKIKDKRKRLSEMNKFVISPFGASEKTKVSKVVKETAQKIISIL